MILRPKRMAAWLSVILLLGARPAPAEPGSHAPVPLVAAPITSTVMRSLDLFEIHLRPGKYANPFDPDQIRVQGHFLSPSGRLVTVNGFYFQDFTRAARNGVESLTPRGAPEWRVRFTPTEVGTWAWTVTAHDAAGTRTTVQKTFRVLAALPQDHGFVHTHGLYFEHVDGTPFFPVGENLAFAGTEGTFSYDLWLSRLGREHASYARLWVGPFDLFTLEKQRGRYDLADAWRLDHAVSRAEQTGILLQLCAESFNALRIRPGPALWKDNPYNVVNHGFLKHPEDFFTDPRAVTGFKKRLRYMAARWGYSPNVLAWELFNEVDLTENFAVAPVRRWHEEMARALRAFDPYAHPITTSFSATEGEAAIDSLAGIDFVQTHLYGAADIGGALSLICQDKIRRYGKPDLVSEVGASVHRAINEKDDVGTWVHDALWSPPFVGAAGSGMPWWWDSYVDARDRYSEFGSLARFVQDVPWTRIDWKPVRVLATRYQDVPSMVYGDVLVTPPQAGWQIAPYDRPVTVEVLEDGSVRGEERMSRLLHGASRPEIYNPTTLRVDYPYRKPIDVASPVSQHFIVRVVEPPSDGSTLRIRVDGRTILSQPLDSEGDSPRSFSVNVTPGVHDITVDNSGSGTITVNYELPGYRRENVPNLRVSGQGSDVYAIVRVENRDYNWLRRVLMESVRPVSPSIVVLDGFQIGDYTVEEWNTRSGTPIPYAERCVDGHVTLHVPALSADVAYKVIKR